MASMFLVWPSYWTLTLFTVICVSVAIWLSILSMRLCSLLFHSNDPFSIASMPRAYTRSHTSLVLLALTQASIWASSWSLSSRRPCLQAWKNMFFISCSSMRSPAVFVREGRRFLWTVIASSYG